MIIYFAILFLCLFSEFIQEFKSKEWRFLVIVVVGIFLCFGYMSGSDWRGYEELYNSIDTNNPFEFITCEYGYYFYMFIFRLLNIDFWTFFILTKIILYLISISYILKYQNKNFYLTLSFFISFFGLSLFIDNPMRTLIAASIYLFSIKYIEKRDLKRYLLVVVFASLFHITVLIMLPLYWLVNLNFKTRSIIITYIAINILLWVFNGYFRALFSIQSGIPYIDSRLAFYFSDDSSGTIYSENRIISLGLLVRFLLFTILVLSRKKIVDKYGNVFFNLAVFSFFFHRLGISIPIFGRFLFYISIPFCISMIDLKNSFTLKSRKLYLVFLLFIIFFTTFKLITFDYKYIPYTNYLTYIFEQPKPTYEERSNYNFKYSPYKKNN